MKWGLVVLLAGTMFAETAEEAKRRVRAVMNVPGFVALWDFVARDPGDGRFAARTAPGEKHDFRLDAINYVREYWGVGRAASYADFPLLGRGPFGQAVQFRAETDPTFRPVLLVPRERLHDSGLDVKGPGRSVSMVIWMIRQGGRHAIAGIWHEGTDLKHGGTEAKRVEPGMRQYALFAGLAANNGASAAHVSENGKSSFGDKYARNISVTPDLIPVAGEDLDSAWSAVGMVYDNRRRTVTSYLNGKANDYWIEEPEKHPFFQWPAKAWKMADGGYKPPEGKARKRRVLSDDGTLRVVLEEYEFTKVRATYEKGQRVAVKRELAALRVNPFWFGHDLYSPASMAEGGPFTIGRVIHTERNPVGPGYIGGVAVYGNALSSSEMRKLGRVGMKRVKGKWVPAPILSPG